MGKGQSLNCLDQHDQSVVLHPLLSACVAIAVGCDLPPSCALSVEHLGRIRGPN